MSTICCKFCSSMEYVKNGIIYNKQRYKCKKCFKTFRENDDREKYSDEIKAKAILMYLNNCGIRIIERILGVSNVLVLHWLNNCGTIVENEVKKIKKESKKIPILEMDELYT